MQRAEDSHGTAGSPTASGASARTGVIPIVVRLAFAKDPWPERSGHTGLEEAAALRLSAALHDPAKLKVAQLRAQAQRLLGSAVVAYAKARAVKAPALGFE